MMRHEHTTPGMYMIAYSFTYLFFGLHITGLGPFIPYLAERSHLL